MTVRYRSPFFLLGVVALFFCWSCQTQDQQPIHLTIDLSHFSDSGKTAYLDLIEPTENVTIDTAAIQPTTGKIEFNLYGNDSEELYRVRTNGNSFLLIIGKENVTVNGDYRDPGNIKISGSSPTVELQEFITKLNEQNLVLNQLSTQVQLLEQEGKDSLRSVKANQLREDQDQLTQSILNQATATSNPIVALFALGLIDPLSGEEGKTVFEGLEDRFPNNKSVQKAVGNFKRVLNNAGEGTRIGEGDQAPNLKLPNPSGDSIALADYAGKYVLLDFWASWCVPCRRANPELVRIYSLFKKDSFSILGVSLDSRKSSWVKAIKDDRLTWSQISDLRGWKSMPAESYHVEAIPSNFLIDPDGQIIAQDLSPQELKEKLSTIFE